jgi:aromatic-amino-acid transaminase
LLECVKLAERSMTDKAAPRGYLPIDGIAAYDRVVQALVLGSDSDAIKEGRAVTVQALGGTGALKIGADFLRALRPRPSLDQRSELGKPSVAVRERRLQGQQLSLLRREVAWPRLRRDDGDIGAGARRVHRGAARCCHNPTGADPTTAQWASIVEMVRARGIVPFLDTAYQGFADGIEADGAVVRKFAATPGPLLISIRFRSRSRCMASASAH